MELHVTSQEAAATLEQLLDRVSDGVTTVVIERDGRPVGHIVAAAPTGTSTTPPVAIAGTMEDLVQVLKAWPRLDDGWAEGVEEAVRLGNQPMPAEDPWDR